MNVVFLSAYQQNKDPGHALRSTKQMHAQLVLLGLDAHPIAWWGDDNHEDRFLVLYRTDHELQQVKRLAAAHKQQSILVLENIRVLPEGTIAQGGVEVYTRPSDGYYQGEHVEQLIEFHRSRPLTDCTLLPASMGGLYITVTRS